MLPVNHCWRLFFLEDKVDICRLENPQAGSSQRDTKHNHAHQGQHTYPVDSQLQKHITWFKGPFTLSVSRPDAMVLAISLWLNCSNFLINQASHSKNELQLKLIRYDAIINVDALNQSLVLSVNGPQVNQDIKGFQSLLSSWKITFSKVKFCLLVMIQMFTAFVKANSLGSIYEWLFE